MKIKRLKITGFKSFKDKVSIVFPSGICSIVGPNGCGKSNIIDAIRWVMGEQSVKQLRGKKIEDIIFSGAGKISHMNMAEVSLTLSNDRGICPVELKDFTEVELTRRVYRSGERSYFLNKQPCRLKDIHNVFFGSGMGAKSYSVIQQGNIGAITDANPIERRIFVEEAAGITGYKARKLEALRKLSTVEDNLVRLNDIISEIERQKSSLRRQVKKAKQYKEYQKKIEYLDILIGIISYDEYTKRIEDSDFLLQRLKDKDTGHLSQLDKLNAEIEKIKLNRAEKNDFISRKKSDKFDLQRKVDRYENNLAHCKSDLKNISEEVKKLQDIKEELLNKNQEVQNEIVQIIAGNKDIKEKIEAVKTQIKNEESKSLSIGKEVEKEISAHETARSELIDLAANQARLKNAFQNVKGNKESILRTLRQTDEQELLSQRKLSGLRQKQQKAETDFNSITESKLDIEKKIEILKSDIKDKIAQLQEQIKHAHTIEIELNNIKSRYNALHKMEKNFEWYKDGVRAVMRAKDDPESNIPDIIGLTPDIIETEPGFETAVEVALGEALQYVIVKDSKTGFAFIEYLKTKKAGRCGFIPCDFDLPERAEAENNSSRLINHIKVKTGFENIAQALLGHILIAENIEEAKQIYNRSQNTVVTKEGDILSVHFINGGSKDETDLGILAKKQELKNLKNRLDQLNLKLESALNIQKQGESELKEAEKKLQQKAALREEVLQKENSAEKTLYKLTEDLKNAKRDLDITRLEQDRLRGEAEDIEDEISKSERAVLEVDQQVKSAQKRVEASSKNIEDLSLQTENFNKKIMELRLNLTSFTASLESGTSTLKRLEDFQKDRVDRLRQLDSDIFDKLNKEIENQNNIKEYEDLLKAMFIELKEVDQVIEESEAEFTLTDNSLKEHDTRLSEIKTDREQILQKIQFLDLQQSQRRIKRENIEERIKEQYRGDISEFRSQLEQKAIRVKEKNISELEKKLADHRKKIARITDVNLGAIKEYEQLKNRYDFLCEQKEDLLKAMEDLNKVIKKISRITHKRFMNTFEQINKKLEEVFPRLFEGGEAKLILTESDRPLESGVELTIHPPGKRVTTLSLLSGGEKALSAIAFIFSIFLIKPASFCLMDEIDAPLDDANIYRFNELLKIIGKESQIIMITHNKRTMEFSDTLLGITMEKKGVSKIVSVDFLESD